MSDKCDTSFNTILWGKLPFYSNIVGDLILREEASIWEHLFLKRSSDFLKPLDYFSNIDSTMYNFGLVVSCSNDKSMHDMFLDILQHKPNYLDLVYLYHALATEDNIQFEMFQKSFFYEIFFHLLQKEPKISKPIFLAICKDYMGLDICEKLLDDVFRFYSNKYACMVIPRRHGKTFMTGSCFVALLLSTLNQGLKLGYYSHTKDLSQTVKSFVITKINEMKVRLTESRYCIMTPTDSVVVKIINEQKATVFSNTGIQDDDFNCLAKFKSARNDNALRGDDLNILVVDETFSINRNRFGTILAHGQKTDNKIIFLTSPVNHKVSIMSEVAEGLRNRTDINFYHICYFCNNKEHIRYITKQPACPRLIFYKPDHIIIDKTNRYLSNLLAQSKSGFDDELGNTSLVSAIYGKDEVTKLCPFSTRILNYLTYSVNAIDDSTYIRNVFVYLDPNYCDSISSGIGLLASSLTKDDTPCVLYLDHKFIQSEELGKVNEIIFKMLLHCIHHVARVVTKKRDQNGVNKHVVRNIFIAIENNSERNSVAVVYEQLKQCLKDSNINVSLYYTATENRITKQLIRRAGYTLLSKYSIFSQTIQYINEKLIWFSNQLYSYHLHQSDINEIEYLTQNMQSFKFSPVEKKFSGKSSSSTDDLIVALIMSVFLSRTYTASAEKSDWMSLSCWLPISKTG